MQTLILVLSALVTIVAGLKLTILPESSAANFVLVLGASITILTAHSALYSPKETWQINANLSGQLKALLAEIEFTTRSESFDATARGALSKKVFDRYQTLLQEHNVNWSNLRKK